MRRSSRRLIVVMLMASVAIYLYDRTRVSDVISFSQMGIYTVDIQGHDVIVLLDILDTGMTSLSRALMHDLGTDASCVCPLNLSRCSCRNSYDNPWLFNAYNATGWVCGEQADFTTLTKCPIDYWFEKVSHDNREYRRYALMTMLREPAARFISEWRHLVQEDTYFKNEPRLFRNESLELQKKGHPCLLGVKISEMSLEQFLECKDHPATNRQTRMLANLTEVDKQSYHGDSYNNLLLASAARTLESLPFFGIYERPSDTQILLEMTLGIKFVRPLQFVQDEEYTPSNARDLSGTILRRIRLANHLDVRLYNHALFLFQSRIMAITNPRIGDIVPQIESADPVSAKPKEEEIAPPSIMRRETNKNTNFHNGQNSDDVIEIKSDDEENGDVDGTENYRDNVVKVDKTNVKGVSAFRKREGDFDSADLQSFIDAINLGKMAAAEKQGSSNVMEGYAGEDTPKASSYNDRPVAGHIVNGFQSLLVENENNGNSATSDDYVDDNNENDELNDFLRSTEDDGEENKIPLEETSLKPPDFHSMESYGQSWEKANDVFNMANVEGKGEQDIHLEYFEAPTKAFHDQSQPKTDTAEAARRGLETGFSHLVHLKQQRQLQPLTQEEEEEEQQQQHHLQQYQKQPHQQQQQQHQHEQQQPYGQQQQLLQQHYQLHLQKQQQQFQQQQYQQHQHEQQQLQQEQYHQQPQEQQQQFQQPEYQQHPQEQQQQFQQQQYQQQQQQQQQWQQESQKRYLSAGQKRATTAMFSPMNGPSKHVNLQGSASHSNVYFQSQPKSGFYGELPSASSENKFKERRALDVAKVQRMFV